MFLPGGDFQAITSQAVAYGTHAGRYKTVKKSAICPPSEDGSIRFRYWSVPDVKHQSVSESIVQTSRSNEQFAIHSHLNSIGVPTSGELCRMPLQDFIYVRNMESFWRYEERSDGVYVESESVAVLGRHLFEPPFLVYPTVKGLFYIMLDDALRTLLSPAYWAPIPTGAAGPARRQ